MTPKSEALAFRIWAFCEPQGWNVTPGEIAEAVGATTQRIGRVLAAKGWTDRVRSDAKDRFQYKRSVRGISPIGDPLDFLGNDFGRFKHRVSALTNYT